MKSYNLIEKNLSKLIKFSPFLHSKIKLLYQKISFLLNKQKGFQIILHQKSKLVDFNIKNIFFGYYDHMPFSKDMKYFLCHEISSELSLNLYDFLTSKIKLKKNLSNTQHFNLQQGIRPIWIDNNKVIFNRVLNNKLISSIYDIKNDRFNDFDFPVQEISEKNNIMISMDYSNLDIINKDYGYGLKGEVSQKKINGIIGYNYILDKSIFEISSEKIHSISQNKNLPMSECEFNHISHSPYDDSFVFIYRNKSHKGFSELYHYNYRENDLKVIYSGSLMSHYCWIDRNIIFAYLEYNSKAGFFEIDYNDSINLTQKILYNSEDNASDGHPSVSPDNKWIVYDSYPDKARQSHLYIVRNDLNMKSQKILIGKFYSPLKFNGYNRCDLHPRWSPDGKYISIDSAHEGERRTYLIDVSQII